MEIFSPRCFSFLFKAFIVLFPVTLILKILRNLYIDKTINAYIALPDERKQRIIRLYRSAVSMWRIFLWIMPFGFLAFLALPVLLFIYPELVSGLPGVDMRQVVLLLGIVLLVGYILVAEDSYYKKKILKAIDKSAEREMT
jgi:hypothetical protein